MGLFDAVSEVIGRVVESVPKTKESKSESWQDKLERYKSDRVSAQLEVARAKYTYENEKAKGASKQRLDQISHWADQVRNSAGISHDDPVYGNPDKSKSNPYTPSGYTNVQTGTKIYATAPKKVSAPVSPVYSTTPTTGSTATTPTSLPGGVSANMPVSGNTGLGIDFGSIFGMAIALMFISTFLGLFKRRR